MKVIHYVTTTASGSNAILADVQKLPGYLSHTYVDTCKWTEFIVDADSMADRALRKVSMSRKELK